MEEVTLKGHPVPDNALRLACLTTTSQQPPCEAGAQRGGNQPEMEVPQPEGSIAGPLTWETWLPRPRSRLKEQLVASWGLRGLGALKKSKNPRKGPLCRCGEESQRLEVVPEAGVWYNKY